MTVAKPSRVTRNADRERTLEADNSALLKNTIDSVSSAATKNKDEGGFSGLSKSSTVIHVPQAKRTDKYQSKTTTTDYKGGEFAADKVTNGNGHKATTTTIRNDQNGESYTSRYKNRNDRDTSNRYKDTQELIESLKAPTKSNYSHYGQYDDAGTVGEDSVSSYYKSRYDPDSYGGGAGDKPSSSSSAAARRTKSYRTRKEASKERKHLTMKLSAVNMDIDDSPPPSSKPAAATAVASSTAGASSRTYKQYGAPRKSTGTGLSSGGYQRSQTQKLFYDIDDSDIYHPPTQRDNKRKEIQSVLRKYAQYDDEDLRRTGTNPYASSAGIRPSATSANLAYGGGAERDRGTERAHLYPDRRDPIAEHYGLGGGSSYYPRSHYGYDGYPSYGSTLSKPANPYSLTSSSGGGAGMNPYNPLAKTYSSAAVYNSSYLSGGAAGSSAAASRSAAAERSRRNLMSFVRELSGGFCVVN